MLLYGPILIIVLTFGMYLVKYNANDYKNSKTELLELSNMSNNEDHSIALRALGWEPLHIIRKKAKARMMYKTLNKLGPESLSSLFTYKNEITNYKLRNVSSGLCLPKPRTNSMKKSFMYNRLNYGTLFQTKLGKANPYHAFKRKLLVTFSKFPYT